MSDRYKIGISGSYGGLNLGDEAILQSMLAQLRSEVPAEITVFTRDPEDTRRRHRVERAIPVRTFSRAEVAPEIERLDLFILGGGGILYDADAQMYLREAVVAQESGVPVMLYAIGAGPLKDPNAQALVRDCLNKVDVITVREKSAHKVLEEAGVEREIVITGDPALLLEPEPLPPDALAQEGLERDHPIIGMSVREPGVAAPDLDQDFYHALLANAADFMVDRFDADIVVLGMRLHFLIFAALRGVPFVALPYANKVSGFLEDLQIATPPIELVNAGRLIAYLDECWDRKDALRAHIAETLPALKERALETHRIAVKLLTPRTTAEDGSVATRA